MTFVAQPFEQLAEDLVTALTGGIVREEHPFSTIEEKYTLTSGDIIPASLRVVGQRNEAFQRFELGTDFVYKDSAICWKPDGKRPDERSYFYASYYPSTAQRRLTDRNPGSVVSTVSRAYGRVLAVTSRQMELIYRSGFVDTASGASLDHVAALLAIERKDARFASGEVLLKRTTPAPADIGIPAGTLVSTALGITFETTDKRTLRRGQLAVTAAIRAQQEGTSGGVDAGAITILNRPIFGIETVVNERNTVFAREKESDEELRRRIKATLERAGKATVDAIKYALIEEIAEITENNIQVAEKPDAPGLVEVRLGLDAPATPELVQRIEESIFYARPAGVRVTHNLPSRSATPSAAKAGISRDEALADFAAVSDPPDAEKFPDNVLAAMPEGIVRLRIEVLLRPAQRNLSAAQIETIEDAARNTVVDYVTNLPMGAPFIYNKLLARIVQPDDVADAAMLVGAGGSGSFESYRTNLSTSGRKARIEASDIFAGLMVEPVTVDVYVRVKSGTVSDQVHSAIEDAVNRAFVAGDRSITKRAVTDAVRAAMAGSGVELVEPDPVVLNAEFEESGRLLSDTAEVVLEPYEEATLGAVEFEPAGVLNG